MTVEEERRAAVFERSKVLRTRLDEMVRGGTAQAAATAGEVDRLAAEAAARSSRVGASVGKLLAGKRAQLRETEAELTSLRARRLRWRRVYAVRILLLSVVYVALMIALGLWRLRVVLTVVALAAIVVWLIERFGPFVVAYVRDMLAILLP